MFTVAILFMPFVISSIPVVIEFAISWFKVGKIKLEISWRIFICSSICEIIENNIMNPPIVRIVSIDFFIASVRVFPMSDSFIMLKVIGNFFDIK